jgi:L-threonine kinase
MSISSVSVDSLQRTILHEATVAIPAGAGEFVQGQLVTGEDFLVTNPVACFATIRVGVTEGTGLVRVSPVTCQKVYQAVKQTLCLLEVSERDVHVQVTSAIPTGKGMASSTADIVGAIEATARALGHSVSAEFVSTIAIAIEPSDGLMYRGIVAYNHRRGRILEHFGSAPRIHQLIVDTGGEIDTIAFNEIPKHYTREELGIQARALDLMRSGLTNSDIAKIGEAATLSAMVNQRLLPKANFAEIVSLAHSFGACGVVCAHSGTILSLLFAPENVSGIEQAQVAMCRKNYAVRLTHSIMNW